MINTHHAVTPTDTRQAPALASEKPEQRLTEIVDELWDLSQRLADEAARSDIECCCRKTTSGPHDWYDTRLDSGWSKEDPRLIQRSLRYFELRGDICTDYQVVRSAAFPSLIRFETRA